MSTLISKAPRLLVITSTFPRNKADNNPRFVFDLCLGLKDQFDIHVLCPHTSGTSVFEMMNGLSVYRFRYLPEKLEVIAYDGGILSKIKSKPLSLLTIPFFLLAEIIAIVRLIHKLEPDFIHAHWLIPQAFTTLIARIFCRFRPPLLAISHGGDLYGLGRFFKHLLGFIAKRVDHIAVVSTPMREQVLMLGVKPSNISVAPMGTDLSNLFTPPSNDKEREKNKLLFVGRLVEKKGVSVLLHAMKNLIDKKQMVLLDIVGDGPNRRLLEALTDELGISTYVNFIGSKPHNELLFYYRRSAILIMPSIVTPGGDQEGFGLVNVEAMGCGCPVIASDLKVIRDIIKHDVNGILVPQNNDKELADAIERSLNNAEKLSRLSKNSTESIQKFDWKMVVKQYSKLTLELSKENNQ